MPDRVKKQLADRGLMPEDWGGNDGVRRRLRQEAARTSNLLMEMICLVADLQDLKATPERPATGVVLEAKLDRGRGAVATVLVQNGRCDIGDNFIVGNIFGKVRAMFDDRGKPAGSRAAVNSGRSAGSGRLAASRRQFVVVADRDKARGRFPNTANRKRAKPRWPRVPASRSKVWRSRSRPPA